MFDLEKLVRKNVRSLTPYSCARDEFQGSEGIFLDANENPYGTLNRYPDPYQKELKNAISSIKGIPVNNIFLGNGSDEIIDLCFRIFCKPGSEKALTFTPSYGMYEVAASANDTGLIKVHLDKDFQIDIEKVKPHLSDNQIKIILICSPNNPTGNCFKRSDIELIITNFEGIVLIDEAYIDFSEELSWKMKLDSYPNLIVMQTFSKAFGMASARIGMAFASFEIVGYFNKMKAPYNISSLNQKAVLEKLRRMEEYDSQIKAIKEERERVSAELSKLPFTETVYHSDANFVLVKVKDAGFVYNYLVERGIIIRNRSSVVKNCIRITVGTRQENDILINMLKTISL